jgi:hypothetical protein
VYIAAENQSRPAEGKGLAFANTAVTLFATKIGIGFQQTVISELGIPPEAQFIIPFGGGSRFARSWSGLFGQ